jgi:hypothetical protein
VSVETSPSTGCNCSNKHKASMMLLVKWISSQMLEHSVIMSAASSAWEGHESWSISHIWFSMHGF